MLTRKIIAGMILFTLVYGGIAGGTTYYVATDGNNSNPGSEAQPWKTIQKAADTMIAGDSVYIRGGTYYEKLLIKRGGSGGNYITFQPYNNENVTIICGETVGAWIRDANGIYYQAISNFSATTGYLIKKAGSGKYDGYAITEVNSYNELLNPNIASGTGIDEAALNLSYFNQNEGIMYLKLGTDGNSNDIYVIKDGSRRVEIEDTAPYVEIKGLEVKYAYDGIKSYANYTKIINNKIMHTAQQGILCATQHVRIEGNYIAYIGTPLWYISGQTMLTRNNQDHSIYFTGQDSVIANNTLEKCIGGQALHPCSCDSNYPKNCEIYGNYVVGGFVGTGENIKVYNNIIQQKDVAGCYNGYTFILYHSSGYQIYNNTIVGRFAVIFDPNIYTTEVNNVKFKNNIVYGIEQNYNIALGYTDLNKCDIDYNIYYGGNYWSNSGSGVTSDFATWRNWMSAYGCEQHSQNIDPQFIDKDANDFHLLPNSPCINAGDNNAVNWSFDIDGQPRVMVGVVDIGADEYDRVGNITKSKCYFNIQDAIDDASSGDEIVVYPGTYYGGIDFDGKTITLHSACPNDYSVTEATVIDGNGAQDVVTFSAGSGATLRGFTITDGESGGVSCSGSTPAISNCIIRNNGRVGVGAELSTIDIKNCLIYNNNGAGILFSETEGGIVRNNTIVNNSDYGMDVEMVNSGDEPMISNCIFWNNDVDLSGCSATYSCIQDGYAGTGNISSDPCFINPDGNDFHLRWDSPCIGTGDPSFTAQDENDIDGQPRKMDGCVDIGADEVTLFGMKVESVTGDENQRIVTTTGATYVLSRTGMDMYRRIDPHTNEYDAANGGKGREVAELSFNTDIGPLSTDVNGATVAVIQSTKATFKFYSDSFFTITAKNAFTYTHTNLIAGAPWNAPLNPSQRELDRMWTDGYGGSLHAVMSEATKPVLAASDVNYTTFSMSDGNVMSHMVYPPKTFDFNSLYGQNAKPFMYHVWTTTELYNFLSDSNNIVAQMNDGKGIFLLGNIHYKAGSDGDRSTPLLLSSGVLGYEFEASLDNAVREFIDLVHSKGGKVISYIYYPGEPSTWRYPSGPLAGQHQNYTVTLEWMREFQQKYNLDGWYLDSADCSIDLMDDYDFIRQIRTDIGDEGIIEHHDSLDAWDSWGLRCIKSGEYGAYRAYRGLRAIMINAYVDYQDVGETGEIAQVDTVNDPYLRYFACGYGMSQASGLCMRVENNKSALTLSELNRLFGENLNGRGGNDYCWSTYFKPAYDKRRLEYLEDRESFVYDINWPINPETGWFRNAEGVNIQFNSGNVVISWTTGANADSNVFYTSNGVWWINSSTDTPYNSPARDSNKVTSHSVTLSGLAPGYYEFRIRSSNCAASVFDEIIWSYIGTFQVPFVPPNHQWKLDETSGTIAHDSIAGDNGSYSGSTPNWVNGFIGGAIDLTSVPDYFSVSSLNTAYNEGSTFTVAGWFKTSQTTGIQTIVGQWWGDGYWFYGWQVLVESNKVKARFGTEVYGAQDVPGTIIVNDDEWHHFALVRNGLNSVVLYVDGEPNATAGTVNFDPGDTQFRIGDGSAGYAPLKGGPFNGMIDDVMIFNRVLSAAEVEQLYLEGLIGKATNPSPANLATGVSINADLTWTAGERAETHDVYFGTTSPGTFRGNQVGTTFDPGTLINGMTYYWRVDEKNTVGTTIGTVWSFTTVYTRTLTCSSTDGGNVTTPGEGALPYDHGTDVNIVATANTNYHFVNWTGTAVDSGKVTNPNSASTTVTMDGDYTVIANFAIDQRSLTISDIMTGGTVTTPGTGTFWYDYNTDVNIAASADFSYHFEHWAGTAVDAGRVADPNAAATTVLMDANYTLEAHFALDQFTVMASADANGGIVPNGAIVKEYGSSQDFNALPNTGYEVDQWYLDGNSVQTGGNTYNLTNITAVHTVVLSFKKIVLTVTANSGANGTITPSGAVPVDYGCNQQFDANANTGYTVDKWTVDGNVAQTGETTYTLSNITTMHTVAVSFKILTYTISASAGANGSIDPTGDIVKDYGSSQLFTATPATDYNVNTWYLDGAPVQSGGTTYTLSNITATHTVSVSFVLNPPSQATNPSPANLAIDVNINADLSWTAGDRATARDVYFGTVNPPPLVSNSQVPTTYDTGTMSYSTTYYWRIDELNGGGTTTGTVWSFTTVAPPDTTPPSPNPMTWASVPKSASSTSITMTATTASDTSLPVQYYFECTNDGNKSSGWQTSTTYIATGLTTGTPYTFRVKARDSVASPNETGWSVPGTAVPITLAFIAAGTAQSGTGAITVAWPTHQAGDIALLFVESCGGQAATLSTPAGFAAVANSPQYTGTGTAGTRISVFWCRATSSSMGSPTVADPGDHVYGRILTFRGVISTGNPWDVTAGGTKGTASTTTTFGTVTTSVNNDLIVLAASRDNSSTSAAWSNWTNTNLSSLTEQSDGGTTSGNGGGVGVATGLKSTAGSTGSTTATVTSSVDGHMTIALKPN